MRILKLGRRSASYWRARYEAEPNARGFDYEKQKRWFCQDFFGPSDTWEFYLRRAGYEAQDIISGIEPLDAAWRRENGGDEHDIGLISQQVQKYNPDIVVLEAIQSFSVAEITRIRDHAPNLKGLIGVTGFDLRDHESLRAVDLVLTCMPNLAEFVRSQGGRSIYFPWWFDPRVLDHLDDNRTIDCELTFVGNIDSGPHLHDVRRDILRWMAKEVDISIYSNIETRLGPILLRYLTTKSAYELSRLVKGIGLNPTRVPITAIRRASKWPAAPKLAYDLGIFRRVRPSAYGIRMYEILRSGRSTVNVHIGIAEQYAANMRLFEATGAGVCLLTDWKKNLSELFDDNEVVSYRSVNEAVEKAKWLVENPGKADEIATRGQAKTLKAHGFEQRIPLLEEAINECLVSYPYRTQMKSA